MANDTLTPAQTFNTFEGWRSASRLPCSETSTVVCKCGGFGTNHEYQRPQTSDSRPRRTKGE